MGDLFRRFWLPVALSDELPAPDAPPVRIRVMAEDLVAFRDSDGRVGLVDAYCAHRGAPLFFGRNEECGLRCLYHGWKYDVEGHCLDAPNAPEGAILRSKIRLKSYACVDAGGLVWAYMGAPAFRPPFPEFEWLKLPPAHRYISKFRLACNYLQAMEGDYDPSHGAFLHMRLAERSDGRNQDASSNLNNGAAGSWMARPETWGRLEDSDSGVLCVTETDAPDGGVLATVGALWMMPVFCTHAIAGTLLHAGSFRVPIDNTSAMFYRLRWSYDPLPESEIEAYRSGGAYYPALVPGTWQPRDNIGNDYNVDRFAQKYETFSGIRSFPMQDAAMVEDQRGPIADRTQEHLTSADVHVIHIRQRLLKAAKALAGGVEPSEPRHPEAYSYHYEEATGHDGDEAVALARAKATSSRFRVAQAMPASP
jgi:phenylpropionate dioxygenase-like ring-hydroxylating dioxygenase large terminal subunit